MSSVTAHGTNELKVAVPASGGSLNALISISWRKAAYFLIADPSRLRFEAFANPSFDCHGCDVEQIAILLIRRGASIFMADRVEPEEREILERAGLRVAAGFRGVTRTALMRYDHAMHSAFHSAI